MQATRGCIRNSKGLLRTRGDIEHILAVGILRVRYINATISLVGHVRSNSAVLVSQACLLLSHLISTEVKDAAIIFIALNILPVGQRRSRNRGGAAALMAQIVIFVQLLHGI